jgi:hypothetical protein
VRLDEDGSTLFTLHDSGHLIRTPVAGGASRTLGTFSVDHDAESLIVSPKEGLAAVVDEVEIQILTPTGEIIVVPVGTDTSPALTPDGRSVLLPSCADGHVRTVNLVDGAITSDATTNRCLWLIDLDREGTGALGTSVNPVDESFSLELYDTRTWERRGILSSDVGRIDTGAFEASTGDATVVSVGSDVRRWAVSLAAWRASACRIAGRNLDRIEWARFVGDEPYRATCPELPEAKPVASPASPPPRTSPSPAVVASPTAATPRLCEENLFSTCYLSVQGHYHGGSFSPSIGFDLDVGWYQVHALPSVIGLVRGESQFLSIFRGITKVYDDDGKTSTIDGTPKAFLEWLRTRRTVTVDAFRPSTLAGLAATEIDLSVLSFAPMFSTVDGGGWAAEEGARWRIRIAALDPDTTLMFLAESPADTFDEYWDQLARPVAESIVLE